MVLVVVIITGFRSGVVVVDVLEAEPAVVLASTKAAGLRRGPPNISIRFDSEFGI